MLDTARVISVKGNTAKVVIKETGSCSAGGCSGCKGCGTTVVDAINIAGAKVGQDVKIEFKSSTYIKSAALVYGLPLVLFLVGIISGISICEKLGINFPKELFGAATGTALWIVSYFVIRFVDKKFGMASKVGYEIVEII